jgi:hypothetical protein
MKRTLIVSLLFVAMFLVWYFKAPIKWTFGLRFPKNWEECSMVGQIKGQQDCYYQDLYFEGPR